MIMYDLTVCIPTFNGSDTIQNVLKGLMKQGIKLRVIIMDNGSTDGTPEMLETAIKNNWYGDMHVELYKMGRAGNTKQENISMIRKKLAELVDTELMFWLDDDILIPPFTLRLTMEEIRKHPQCGLMALQYQSFNHHPAIGASMMFTHLAKEVEYTCNGGQPCECNHVKTQIEGKGFHAMFMRKITALDLNYIGG